MYDSPRQLNFRHDEFQDFFGRQGLDFLRRLEGWNGLFQDASPQGEQVRGSDNQAVHVDVAATQGLVD